MRVGEIASIVMVFFIRYPGLPLQNSVPGDKSDSQSSTQTDEGIEVISHVERRQAARQLILSTRIQCIRESKRT